MDKEETKKREKEREDKAFKLFESYIRAIIRCSTNNDIYDDERLNGIREEMREFIRDGA